MFECGEPEVYNNTYGYAINFISKKGGILCLDQLETIKKN